MKSSSSTKKKFPSFASKNHSLGKRQRERDSFYYTIPRPLKEREREIIVSADLQRSFTEEL
tara:strand:+ start:3201 stop:3383 length:183 start_codon:yes stop_codon:yes gene_type:complete